MSRLPRSLGALKTTYRRDLMGWELTSVPVGTAINGDRIAVDIRLDNGEFSVSWIATAPRCRRAYAFGQIAEIDFDPRAQALAWELREIWKRWHLNHMHAGCEHQRKLGWESDGYDKHPSELCPECGYAYGTKWNRIELPAEVLEWLERFRAEVCKAL